MLKTFLILPGYAEYQAWGQWSACSEQCGGGKRKRERACTSNSIPCSGDSKEEETCNTQACTNSSKYLLRYLAYLMGLFFGIVKLKWTINHSSIVQKISPYLGKRRSIIEISKVINFYRESLLLCLVMFKIKSVLIHRVYLDGINSIFCFEQIHWQAARVKLVSWNVWDFSPLKHLIHICKK